MTLILHLLFLVSGALGLVYEVLWIRQLTAVFGATTLATTATLSGFFLGLAVGSAALGARARRWRRPLVAFGLMEMGVGLGALLVRPMVGLYGHLYPGLHALLAHSSLAFALTKLVLAMAAVGLPAFCMGGTLPTLAQATAPVADRLGVRAGGLYAINVLGATVGALSVPFLLLPRLGVGRSLSCAVGGSLAVGLAACALGWGFGGVAAKRRQAPEAAWGDGRVLALAFISGAATLALQVLWMRMFSFVHENAIHSFAVVVAVFLGGLAAGAALARAALRRGRAPERLLAAGWLIAGALAVASPRLFHRLTGGFAPLDAGGAGDLQRLLLLAVGTMLPATVALGMALPVLMEMAGRAAPQSGEALGRLLASNTLGAIAGPLLVTFAIAPALGLWRSIVGIGLALAATGTVALGRRSQALAAAAALLALLLFAPAGLPPVRVAPGERIVSLREGTYGTTAVLVDERDRWITQNNSYVLGGAAAADEERFQAHLPLLLHARPRRVAFVGLGSGITAGAALQHPVESVRALEIVPEVVEAARHDFADLNGGVVDDRRVTVVADDGRNDLAIRSQAFDVVVGDLLVPWRPAEAPLYTREHFESVRRALAPNGVFCQWLPLYQLSEEQLAILARTFVGVFPRTTLWRGNFIPDEATVALIGEAGPQPLDPTSVDARLRALPPGVAADNPFLAHPAGLWIHLLGPVTVDAPWLRGAPENSDAAPWIELSSARGRAGTRPRAPLLWPALEAASAAPLPGTTLAGLDQQHASWRATGAALARASLDRGPGGEQRALRVLETLPPELRRALGVD